MTDRENRAAPKQNGSLPVTIVNACLRDGRGGSPTAVLWESGLTDAERRQVPRLAGTSHAVFVSSGEDGLGEPPASLRFFTTQGELPACGHGTVAALVFLAATVEREQYRVDLVVSGRRFSGKAIRTGKHVTATFDPGEVELRPAASEERDLALDALGHDRALLASEIGVASIGRARLLVPIATVSALAALTPDLELLHSGCDRLGLIGCYVHSVPTAGGHLAARMFAPSIGVPEDIANVNSTACLAAGLARRGIARITVDMGDSLRMPATIAATTSAAGSAIKIRVGGVGVAIGRADLDLAELVTRE